MNSYDHPNHTVRREQRAVDGSLVFFQKSKLKAIHVFATGTPPTADTEMTLKLNGETIGKVTLSESFSSGVASSPLLDVEIPQGSIAKLSGASGFAVVAEYVVAPDADQTTTDNQD